MHVRSSDTGASLLSNCEVLYPSLTRCAFVTPPLPGSYDITIFIRTSKSAEWEVTDKTSPPRDEFHVSLPLGDIIDNITNIRFKHPSSFYR